MTWLFLVLCAQSSFDRAQRLLHEGNVEAAQTAIAQAVAEQPDSVPVLSLQGRIAIAAGDFGVAKDVLGKAARLAPASAQAQFLLGFLFYIENDFALAQPAFERARALAPNDARTVLFLALTQDGLANPGRAAPLFEEAIRMEAKAKRPSAETHVAYARMLFAESRFREAQAQVTRALAIDARDPAAHYEQARIHMHRGETGSAIAEAETALSVNRGQVPERQIHFLLSRAYAAQGDQARSAAHKAKFESIPPRLVR